MEPQEAIASARELVEFGWCQGADARDESGNMVHPWDPAAVSWSALGALVAVAANPDDGAVRLEELGLPALALGIAANSDLLQEWNDEPERTHQDIVAAYDVAHQIVPRLEEAHKRRVS
jgi:hypothetical protein